MSTQEQKVREYAEKQILQEQMEHHEVLTAINKLLKLPEGQTLFKYLFKNFDVTIAPERGLEGVLLHEYLGHLRAGNSIYQLSCEADYQTTALLLSKLEKERHEDKYEQYRIDNGIYSTDDN